MKKWNTPVVEELNITETANGFFPFWKESCLTDDVIDCGNGGNENGGSNKGDDEQAPEEFFS